MSKLDKIKTHFRENKKLYVGIAIGAGVTIVAVSTCIILRSSTSEVGNDFRVSPRGVFYKSPIEQRIDIRIEALGDPGNIIQDTTTGTVYASQGQAARELGLNPARISDHLNGRSPHVKGHVFEVLGKATVSS